MTPPHTRLYSYFRKGPALLACLILRVTALLGVNDRQESKTRPPLEVAAFSSVDRCATRFLPIVKISGS